LCVVCLAGGGVRKRKRDAWAERAHLIESARASRRRRPSVGLSRRDSLDRVRDVRLFLSNLLQRRGLGEARAVKDLGPGLALLTIGGGVGWAGGSEGEKIEGENGGGVGANKRVSRKRRRGRSVLAPPLHGKPTYLGKRVRRVVLEARRERHDAGHLRAGLQADQSAATSRWCCPSSSSSACRDRRGDGGRGRDGGGGHAGRSSAIRGCALAGEIQFTRVEGTRGNGSNAAVLSAGKRCASGCVWFCECQSDVWMLLL